MSTEMPCGRWTDSPTYHRTAWPTCYAEEYAMLRHKATTPPESNTSATSAQAGIGSLEGRVSAPKEEVSK